MNEPTALMRDASFDASHVVQIQLGTGNYLCRTVAPSESQKNPGDHEYFRNTDVWRLVLGEKLRANVRIKLKGFSVFEWFPRAPGLFHTEAAGWLRHKAETAVERIQLPAQPGLTSETVAAFRPDEKMSMLRGGIGCVRLRPHQTEFGELWFVAASSSDVAHEGFPVALADSVYHRIIDDIAKFGSLPCDLVGTLKFLPSRITDMFFPSHANVPYLYLLVEHAEPTPPSRRNRDGLVTAAISFQSSYEGAPRVYASYASFEPGRRGSLDRAIEWLGSVYVRTGFNGCVLTDFDEQRSHFEGAVFSLRDVMSYRLDQSRVSRLLDEHGVHVHLNFQQIIGNNNVFSGSGDVTMHNSEDV